MDKRRVLTGCVMCLVASLGTPAAARELGADLRGDELLVEFERVGDATEPAGIYALSPDAEWRWQRVIADGRRPRWSPDHRRFLFWHGGELEIADLDAGVWRPVGLRGSSLDSDCSWWPGQAALACRTVSFPERGPRWSFILGRAELADPLDRPCWRPEEVEDIGRYSLSADGRYVAYESLLLLPGFGPVVSRIRVRDLQQGAAVRDLPDVALRELVTCRPQWQPGGALVAFDVIDPATRVQRTYLWDTAADTVDILGPLGTVRPPGTWGGIERWREWPNTQLVGWSPDGRCVLVDGHGVAVQVVPAGPTALWVIPLDAAAPVRGLTRPEGRLHAACWSPDSRRIAVLAGLTTEPWSPWLTCLRTLDLAEEDYGIAEPEHPAGLVPVWLDW